MGSYLHCQAAWRLQAVLMSSGYHLEAWSSVLLAFCYGILSLCCQVFAAPSSALCIPSEWRLFTSTACLPLSSHRATHGKASQTACCDKQQKVLACIPYVRELSS